MGSWNEQNCAVLAGAGTSERDIRCWEENSEATLRKWSLTTELHSDVYLGYEGTELDHSVSQWPETVLLFPGNHIRVSKEKGGDRSLATTSVNTVFDLWTSACLPKYSLGNSTLPLWGYGFMLQVLKIGVVSKMLHGETFYSVSSLTVIKVWKWLKVWSS